MKRMRRAVAVACLFALPLGTAFAVSLALPTLARADGDDGHEHEPDPFPVSEFNPTLVSAAWTVVPAAAGLAIAGGNESDGASTETFASSLVWGGLIVGPATGYWHGGAGRFAVRGLVLRGATFALASLLAPSESGQGSLYPAFSSDDDAKKWTWIGASTVIVASAVVDVVRARGAVNHVERHHMSVVPTVDPGTRTFGLAVTARL